MYPYSAEVHSLCDDDLICKEDFGFAKEVSGCISSRQGVW